ncbi:MAG: hypothetical protein CSB47_10605 [Proteobacteria bacterium]|nr:MAG: hypothetical protein CSB47_10605 [Pseudomonadota bacterium]
MMLQQRVLPVAFSLIAAFGLANCGGADADSEVTETKKAAEESRVEVETPAGSAPEVAFNWAKVSGRHTKGMVPRNSPVRVEFNRDVISPDDVGKDATKVIKLTPNIEGTATFVSPTELVFVPEKALTSGASYTVDISPIGLKDIPASATPYRFNFSVIPLEFEVKTNALVAAADTGKRMTLTGELLTSDRVMPDKVKKMLTASFQNKPLTIDWQFADNGKQHRFTIKGIERETFASDVVLSWDGAAIGIDQKGKQEVSVPLLNQFDVIDMAVIHDVGVNPYIQVSFSDPLDSSVNLQGLIQIKGKSYEEDKKFTVSTEGSLIKIFPKDNLSGSYTINVNPGIRSEGGQSLTKQLSRTVQFDLLRPQVAFIGNGSIMPQGSRLEIPFKAVAVNAVEVSAFEIYADNMGQFLQTNNIHGDNEKGRVGRYLWRKTLSLSAANYDQWNRYSIDVTDLMKDYNGSLVRLELSVNRQHSTYACGITKPVADKTAPLLNMEDDGTKEPSGWDGISNWSENNYNDYNWRERNDPCKDSYYVDHQDMVTASNNFIASNIGLIAKQDGHGNLHVISTDLRDANPLTGVELEVRNYQGQVMATGTTDGKGFADIKLDGTPFLLVAKKFSDTAYLKLNARTALTVSHFDVGGKKLENGLKGSIYGERGVWRPGDEMYLTFALFDKDDSLPAHHPVTMQLIDPRGRVAASKTSTKSVGDLYPFVFKTSENDPTGNWIARAHLGGSRFSKNLSVETVRPNRLKIDLDFGTETLYKSDGAPTGTLSSRWLHGASAEDLKADIAVRFSSKPTKFTRFSDYSFDDPVREFSGGESAILEGRLDKDGKLQFTKDFAPKTQPPGMLNARFTSRVFENSGAFSISQQSIDYHPFERYIGVKLPKGDAVRGMLLTDTKHKVELGSLTAKGEPVSMNKVKVTLYKINWKWWWDKSAESLARYADSENAAKLQESIVSTKDGVGQWEFEIKYPDWGRYLVRACDLRGDHCSGQIVYVDWPGWAGRAQEEGSGAASRLNLFTDKQAYVVGDKAVVQLPPATEGRALLTVETGSEILNQQWIEFSDKRTKVEIPITAAMAPNAYVNITLLQPHKDKKNERPLRLYGIVPIEVADPNTYLKPVIEAASEWKPETRQTIKVSEKDGKAMNYTLAVVDEGLLGLTNFSTPNLHREFYVKESLGIKTWDLFDSVIGAYNGSLERMLAIGGGKAEVDPDANRKRRFPPVVKVLGPFSLKAGESQEHEVTLPPYLGAVRIMLVAAEHGAFGRAEEEVLVRQPLILQASLPKVLGTEETFDVPVSLFVTDDNIKNVSLQVTTDDFISVVGDAKTSLAFAKTGEKLGFIRLKTKNQVGRAKLKFVASSGEHRSESDIYIDIRRPNTVTTRVATHTVEPGKSWKYDFQPYGLRGTNSASLELSAVPHLHLERYLQYLLRYPYGCLEQTTSVAFPQLYINRLMPLSEQRNKAVQAHISAAIEQMRKFQTAQGEFNYWPGADLHNAWASIYAGNFLVEAKKQGYLVPPAMLSAWLTYQGAAAQRWEQSAANDSHTQAYRLYVLSLAGQPQMSAMNRLRESQDLSRKARWMLASAYHSIGQPDAANSIIAGMKPAVEANDKRDDTFSSHLGDLGIRLTNMVALGKRDGASLILEQISEQLGKDQFHSTQGIAWALMGASHYLGDDKRVFTADYTLGQLDSAKIESDKPLSSSNLPATQPAALTVNNTSGVRLYASVISHGVPKTGDEKNLSEGLSLTTHYSDNKKGSTLDWGSLPNGSSIPQGTDVRISVTVKNDHPDKVEYLALTLPVAAGWEILNDLGQTKSSNLYQYKDQRDDRVRYYFDLKKGEEKTFTIVANAAYLGQFYVPPISVEAMYDGHLQARERGKWVHVVTAEEAAKAQAATTKTISTKRAYLYNDSNDESITTMFVIAGDKVTVLSEAKDAEGKLWYFIRFNGRKVVEKWIKASTTE